MEDVTPTKIGRALGYSDPASLPQDFYEGPIRFAGVLDYDAGAESLVCDLTESDNMIDNGFASTFTLEDDPEITLHIEAIEVRFIGQDIANHPDPADVNKVLRGLFFRHKVGQVEKDHDLGEGTWIVAKPSAIRQDSDEAGAAAAYYQYFSQRAAKIRGGAIRVDLKNDKIAGVYATAAATGTLLGANADVEVIVHGYAYANNFQGAADEAGVVGGGSCKAFGLPNIQRSAQQRLNSVMRFG